MIRTGDSTFIGSIARVTAAPKLGETSLQKEIRLFVEWLTKMSLVMASAVFLVGVARGYDPLYIFINGFIIVIVANVPQGSYKNFKITIYLILIVKIYI